MAKKNFAEGDKARRETNTRSHIAAAAEEEKKQGYYRLNLKLPMEQKEYLQEMAWRSRESVTAYLTELVAADMKWHPERLEQPAYDAAAELTGIDRDALLALADEVNRKSNDGAVNPDPMRPLATSLDLFGYARRIREACGEGDE